MDPIAITTSALSLAVTVTKTTVNIHTFIKAVREARADLDAIYRELSSIKIVLDLLAHDAESEATKILGIPKQLQDQVLGIIENCGSVVRQIDDLLVKYTADSKRRKIQWTIEGHADMAKYRSNLEAHKSALDIAMDMMTWYDNSPLLAWEFPLPKLVNIGFLLSRRKANFIVPRALSKEIKSDTTKILHSTAALNQGQTEIKDDTELIIREITNLQINVPSDIERILEAIANLQAQFLSEDPDQRLASQYVLQKNLESLTSYADSAYPPSVPSSQTESRPDLPHSHEGADSHETVKPALSEEVEGLQQSPHDDEENDSSSSENSNITAGSLLQADFNDTILKIDLYSIINRLLEVRGSKPRKQVQLLEQEIRYLCMKAREIFLDQPMLLELKAPITVNIFRHS